MTDETRGDPPPALTDAAMLARFQNARYTPPASKALGFRMLNLNQAEMWVEAEFDVPDTFTNPMGQVQGGFVTAVLDEVMSVAGVVTSNLTMSMPTLEMKTSFLRPALPGKLRAVGKVLKWGRSIAFVEGEVFDGQGRLLAKATATAKPAPIPQRP
jgi:uncharacterized protein (TIGR00369 family)